MLKLAFQEINELSQLARSFIQITSETTSFTELLQDLLIIDVDGISMKMHCLYASGKILIE